ncbi:MAG TPA: tetratricopeptide repeat protein [Gemmatirosa sp.]
MPDPFLSSEEYDERAHTLYNEGEYDQAIAVLKEGLGLYPHAVELHVGLGYARLAREEFAWARRAFDDALALDAEHEDALAGLAEVLMKFGQHEAAMRTFQHTLELGYHDDVELMLQIGRALFREGLIEEAKSFFEIAAREAPDNAEVVACVGYALHRLGDDEGAATALRRALELDADHVEARIYLGNLLYDAGDYEGALSHLERSAPEDHWDELGLWRTVELLKTVRAVPEGDERLQPWEARATELAGEPDAIDELLAELEEQAERDDQLELFAAGEGAADTAAPPASLPPATRHRVVTVEGREIDGTWDEIVARLREASADEVRGASVSEYMAAVARRQYRSTGVRISARDAESFIRGSADAGLLRIVR